MKDAILEPRAMYLCDQKKDCNTSPNCGICKHTKDINHAKNGPVVNVRDWKKYFDLVEYEHLVTWWEKEDANR